MTDVEGYGKRIRRALRVWASQYETATYAEFGRRVAEIEKRDPAKGPYTTGAVSEWLQNRSEPKIATFRAIEKLTGFRASWLMLGELPERIEDEGQGNVERPKVIPPKPLREIERVADPSIYATEIPRRPRKGGKRRQKPDDRSAVAG